MEWRVEKEFVGASGVTVRVTMLALQRPKYSIEVGCPSDGGRLSRHFGGEEAIDASELILDAASYINARIAEYQTGEEERLRKEKEKRERHERNVEAKREENRKRAGGMRNGKGKER